MKTSLELSIANHTGILQALQPAVSRFEQECAGTVQFTVMPWDTIWKDLVNFGIHGRGADISEVGTTWIDSLISMNSLRPFTNSEINQIGGEAAFLPAAWQTTTMVGDGRTLAIPFMLDVRVIFYWRDMLQKAGVAEETAFSTFEAMDDTLTRLQAVCPTPWALSTDTSTHDTLYSLSSWVWGAGQDFISPDGRKTLLNDPAVRAAMKKFYSLHRFMPRDEQPMDGDKVTTLFKERRTAAMFTGPWALTNLKGQASLSGMLDQIGIALPPGPPFVGGMDLVVWQHTRQERAVIDLIRQLVTPEAQLEYCPRVGMMPARLEAISAPYYSNDPHYKVMVEALRKGRVSTSFPLWGMVEEKLFPSLAKIWVDIFKGPEEPLENIISRNIDVLARRLEITLGG
jgi:multiple sugar transport system substrate-binding protein